MKKIVVVEDEELMREELIYILEKENYEVFSITDFSNISETIIKESPDLILLDLNLIGTTGFQVCKEIRENGFIPILVLTSRDQMKDELHALNLGANDYLTKPCHKDRLLARISNVLRQNEVRNHFVEVGNIRLDKKTFTMYVNDKAVILPENQGKIMKILMKNQEELVTKEMLFNEIWGTTEYIDENALQVNMTRLKKNLEKMNLKHKIVTIRGKGYSFVPYKVEEND